MIELITIPDDFSIYQFSIDDHIPNQILESGFCSITKTSEEISVIANCTYSSGEIFVNSGWKGFKVEGQLDFSMIGIIHNITKPLKEAGISVFVISTYNTDYIFVKEESFAKAIEFFKATEGLRIRTVS